MHRITTTALTAAALLSLAACSESSNAPQADAGASTPSDQPAAHAWVLADAPRGDVSVTQAKSTAAEGERIVVRGRIGGRHEPMSAESPVFTIVDLDLEYCGQHTDDDHCNTPWDYCCETPGTITTNSATVQVQGEGVDLVGAGLKPLDEVVLIGTVGPRPDERVLTILATGLYRVGG